LEIGQGSRPYGATIYQKVEVFDILGAAFPPPGAIQVKLCTAKRTQVPVGNAKFDLNRCNESPLRGEKPDFWPVSKTIPAVCRYAAILPVKTKNKSIVPCWTMHTGRMSCHSTEKGVNYYKIKKTFQFKTRCKGDKSQIENSTDHFCNDHTLAR